MSLGTGTDKVDEGALALYLEDIKNHPLLTRAEEAELARRIRDGDQLALEKLVRSNLRFVVSVAKKYQNLGMSLPDLICEGNVGLVRAAQKFDETKGVKFISYAVWWIRQAILKALAENSKTFRLPINRATTLNKISKKEAELTQKLGREPKPEEVAAAMDMDVDEVRKLMNVSRRSLSLDAPLFEGEEKTLFSYLSDDETLDPEEQTFESARIKEIRETLETLQPREAKIVKLYYGLDGNEPLTLREIGSIFNLSRERIRQIKERAIERLRHQSRARRLQPYH
ncbi:MAG TPA: RNA polymerase sigma factor RpoD/SigA [Gemmatimonadota bacterium]|jgi:RNA polymerase primary sigma factor|nr:RNA polymerase sigma factor RpoD/SigA [Gemmatimonadota bacterium]HKY60345.1 RNA polymerase sigma factor RpoD/SigA [Gemmatimonadota bacterium]HWC07136.1 RNA polymerase sigma factor RpoD/SigA [Gemmatimonadota bacterium]